MDDKSIAYLLEQNKALKDRIKFLEKRVCTNTECKKREKIILKGAKNATD